MYFGGVYAFCKCVPSACKAELPRNYCRVNPLKCSRLNATICASNERPKVVEARDNVLSVVLPYEGFYRIEGQKHEILHLN